MIRTHAVAAPLVQPTPLTLTEFMEQAEQTAERVKFKAGTHEGMAVVGAPSDNDASFEENVMLALGMPLSAVFGDDLDGAQIDIKPVSSAALVAQFRALAGDADGNDSVVALHLVRELLQTNLTDLHVVHVSNGGQRARAYIGAAQGGEVLAGVLLTDG